MVGIYSDCSTREIISASSALGVLNDNALYKQTDTLADLTTSALCACDARRRFHARAGRGHRPPSRGQAPNLAVLLTHCGQLMLRKIGKFDATRFQTLRLKFRKFDFRWVVA